MNGYINLPDISEVKEKQRRVQMFFEKTDFEALVIGRRDNFAWYTCGGNNRVINSSETGFACLVITKNQTYCVAHTMDGPRILDEELKGLDFEPVYVKWFEGDIFTKASQLTVGLRTISDVPMAGALFSVSEIYGLHYPLTEKEIYKYRKLGAATESVIRKVVDEIKPGMSEIEVESMFYYEYGKINATPEVLLIGSDERILKYRHPNPSNKRIEKFLLVHPAVQKWGLHANVTRMVYFGDSLPMDIQQRYETASLIEAQAISMCIPGSKFHEILDLRKSIFKESGFGDELENHFPGGVTGYFLCDASVCNSEAEIIINQAYDWFITITGVKVEELSINTDKGREVLSVTGKWPTSEYHYNGQSFNLPKILLR